MKELYNDVASKWHPIGTFLGMSEEELRTIAQREHDDDGKCFMAMLTVWLRRISPPASWPDIANAVEFTGRPEIAEQLRQKYCKHSA